jgi:nitrogen fixation/metabolism regulation signal transduction histidine kinase
MRSDDLDSQLKLHPPRKMRLLWLTLAVAGAVSLSLLAVAAANTALFQRHYYLLLVVNIAVVVVLVGAVGYQLWQIWQARRRQVFGSRLTTRLVAIFAGMTILPGVLLYLISSQFLSSSIESWADVKIDKGLAAGLSLAQTLIREQEQTAGQTTVRVLPRFVGNTDSAAQTLLADSVAEVKANVAALINEQGTVLAAHSAQGIPKLDQVLVDWTSIAPNVPATSTETLSDGVLATRAVVPFSNNENRKRALVLWFAIPKDIREQSELVNNAFVGYGNFVNGRDFLKQLYGSTLTLALLLAVFSSLGLAMVVAERFARPLARLAQGTRDVADGNYNARQPVETSDELGVLTHSFNTMTLQLADAQARDVAARRQIETSNAYLESVLKNQSAGVLVFDSRSRLKVANTSATVILQAPIEQLREEFLGQWGERQPALHGFAELLKRGFATSRDGTWQKQSELMIGGNARTLLIRGSRLPGETDGGTIVVFDDVSEVIQAQRDTAWSEVARRLAHEIKNPLTPIQLSAERLQMKLEGELAPEQARVLNRATETIVSQVSAMKDMVNDFATYARQPKPGSMQPVDVETLLRDVVALYETHHHDAPEVKLMWASDASMVAGETTRLRQVFHNLLQNAVDAVHESTTQAQAAQVTIRVTRETDELVLAFEDNGPGFKEEVKARAFEPYVTSKPKGTGLGLAIVKKIIDEHHGHIGIANREEGGARVTLRFPLHRQAMQVELLHAN